MGNTFGNSTPYSNETCDIETSKYQKCKCFCTAQHMSLRDLPFYTLELDVIRGPFITGWKPQLSKIYVAISESQDGEEN